MKRMLPAIALAIVAATPVAAQKVYVDFDETVDFTQFKTFAFRESPQDLRSSNELGHTRIQNAIRRQLIETGAQQVQRDPDLWVTYHTAEKEQLRVDSTSMGWGYGPGWYGPGWVWGGYWNAGYGSHTTSVSTFSEGSLVIEIADAAKEQMVWRGIATAVVPASPGKAEKLLDKALSKMAKKYRDQQKKNAKRAGG